EDGDSSLDDSVGLETADVVEGVAEPGQHVGAVLAEERGNGANGRPAAPPRHRQPDTLVVGQARMTPADQDPALARLRLGQPPSPRRGARPPATRGAGGPRGG